jgi:CRISPR-associated protein (TIGR03986 family)
MRSALGSHGPRRNEEIAMTEFFNPYTFVWTPPRDIATDGGDSHASLASDQVSGTITVDLVSVDPILSFDEATVDLVAVDPILSFDEAAATGETHRTYSIARDPRSEGDRNFPWISPSSIKGSLRSAYETVTNSRFGVLEGQHPLGYRRPINQAADIVPARVVALADRDEDDDRLELLFGATPSRLNVEGSSTVSPPRVNGKTLLPGAFVSTALLEDLARKADLEYPNLHGLKVKATLDLYMHNRFAAYRVKNLKLTIEGESGPKEISVESDDLSGDRWARYHGQEKEGSFEAQIPDVAGYLMVTGAKSAMGKHEERFCFALEDANRANVESKDASSLLRTFDLVIASYLDAHGLKPRDEAHGDGPLNNVEWALHMKNPPRRKLKKGDLVWCALDKGGRPRVLLPVSSSRDLYRSAPRELLDPSLRPADSADQLSPADRLFGWVGEAGKGGIRGRIEIRNVKHVCDSEKSCDHVESTGGNAVILPILGSPKPQYGRFYVGDTEGKPLGSREARSDWFKNGAEQALRGRKTYWSQKTGGTSQPDGLPAWLGKGARNVKPGSQNRSVTEWIKPKSVFRIEIQVKGARLADVNALLDLLRSAHVKAVEPTSIHVGFGKPLGLGGLRVQELSTCFEPGEVVRKRLRSLDPRRVDETTLSASDGKKVTEPSSINQDTFGAWAASARGVAKDDVRYPTADNGGGNGYEWFVNNEKPNGTPQSLPLLTADGSEKLESNSAPPKRGQGGGGPRRPQRGGQNRGQGRRNGR